MFDEAPANLPVAPIAPPPLGGPTPPPRPAASVPKPAPATAPAPKMAGGIMMPKKQEPEDIFGDLEKAAAEPALGESGLEEAKPSGGFMRYVVYGLVGLVVVAVLALGGFFFYSRVIATPPAAQPPAPPARPKPPTTPTVPASAPTQEPSTPEAPPVVPETPPPSIPPPPPVQQPVDTDGDGLTDAQEATLGTNANAAATDGDGLPDGEEANTTRTDPLRAATDGDGLTDGDEVKVKDKRSEEHTSEL